LLLALLLGVADDAAAEKVRVGSNTQLRSIEFDGRRSFSEDELRKLLAESTLGKRTTLRGWFDFLPFVDPVEPAPFEPLELQRDVVRIREYYQRNGFPSAEVRYTLEHDTAKDLLDVRFVITEGRELDLASLTITAPDSTPPTSWLPPELHEAWEDFASDLQLRRGKRWGENEARSVDTAVQKWHLDRGYPNAKVRSSSVVDPAAHTVAYHLVVEPGSRARFGDIEVVGNHGVDAGVVRKTVSFSSGDWYSARKLTDAQRDLINLNLFHVAQVEPVPGEDSTMTVRVRVEESKPRMVTGEFGYLSDGGLAVKGEWSHRNFFGGARTLTVSAVSQTGIWALEENSETLLRGSVSLTQRGIIGRSVSLITSPYIDYRDDYAGQTGSVGLDVTLSYVKDAWVRTVSLKYGISRSRVFDYKLGSDDDSDIFTSIQAAIDATGHRTEHSALTLAATLGSQDHPIRPRRLLLLRPSLEVAIPSPWNTVQYTRFDVVASLQRPLRGNTLFRGRVGFGRLWPFGKTTGALPPSESAQRYLDLRPYLFTAGGTSDVRGWSNQLLGPKIPDAYVLADSVTVRANRYVPTGGLTRFSLSSEVRLPFPGLGPLWGIDLFLDGGRVLSPDPTYTGTVDYDQERFFWGTGIGLDRDSPVGPIRLSLGYMLNPTLLDVLEAQEFLDDKNNGVLGQRPYPWTRRLHVHLAFGTGF
jgi:outer membrane protein insertion porin family